MVPGRRRVAGRPSGWGHLQHRYRRCAAAAAAVLVLALVAATSAAPATGQAADDGLAVERVRRDGDVAEVTVSVPPADRLLSPAAAALPRSAFVVRSSRGAEPGPRPTEVVRLADADLEVVFVLDPSAGVDIGALLGTVSELLLGLPTESQVGVVAAGPEARVVAPRRADREAAFRSLATLGPAADGDLAGAVDLARAELSGRARSRPTLVVVGAAPALGRADGARLGPVLEAAGVASYVMALAPAAGAGSAAPGSLPLGGGARFEADGRDPVAFVDPILAELLNQYRLRVALSDPGPTTLDVRVGAGDAAVTVAAEVPAADARAPASSPTTVRPAVPGAAGRTSSGGGPLVVFAVVVAVLAATVAFVGIRARARRRPIATVGERAATVPVAARVREAIEPVGSGPTDGAEHTTSAPPWQVPAAADGSTAPAAEEAAAPSAELTAALGGEQVEGRAAVRQLLVRRRRDVHDVWMAEGAEDAGIAELATAAGATVRTVRPDVLEAAARSGRAEGLLAHAEPLVAGDLGEVTADGGATTIVAVDGGAEPAQLGGLLRSAGAFGVDGVVLAGGDTEPISPLVSATAEGAVEEVPIVTVDDLAIELDHLADQGSVVVGVERHAPSTLLDVDLDLERSPVVLVLDGGGILGDQVRARCDAIVGVDRTTDQPDDAESLARLACLDLTRRRLPVEA